MRSTQLFNLRKVLVLALMLFGASSGWCQENEGNADLDAAFDLKIKAESTKDLDEVVNMCESAIEKGLDEEGLVQAKQLAASSLYEHADQLGQRIFASGGQDRRWRVFRSQALKRLKQATELQPEMVEAWMMIARLNTLPGGDQDEAREAVKQAVDLAGEDREQLSSALFMRATLSEDEEAQVADLNQAIKVNPNNMDAIRVRGAYYLSKGQTENAMEDLNKWLDAGTENTNDYINVVRTLIGMGDKFDEDLQKEALRIIDQAIAKDPENVNPLAIRAQLNVVRDELDAAASDATRALELDPKNIGVLMLAPPYIRIRKNWTRPCRTSMRSSIRFLRFRKPLKCAGSFFRNRRNLPKRSKTSRRCPNVIRTMRTGSDNWRCFTTPTTNQEKPSKSMTNF